MRRATCTITSQADIERLFAEGRRRGRQAALVIVLETPEARDPDGRVLFIAGKRLGTAVRRNRCKRVLREAVRRTGGPWPGLDVALVARPGTAAASLRDLDDAIRRALESAGVER
jgi:ribonuclease P protein component